MEKAGATGKFPRGKICDDDAGELNIRMFVNREKNTLFMDFGGKPVTWLGLDRLAIKDLVERLLQAYSELR
jgi:hypothetical protein